MTTNTSFHSFAKTRPCRGVITVLLRQFPIKSWQKALLKFVYGSRRSQGAITTRLVSYFSDNAVTTNNFLRNKRAKYQRLSNLRKLICGTFYLLRTKFRVTDFKHVSLLPVIWLRLAEHRFWRSCGGNLQNIFGGNLFGGKKFCPLINKQHASTSWVERFDIWLWWDIAGYYAIALECLVCHL